MRLNDYQDEAKRVSKVPEGDKVLDLAIYGLGITGEAGEVADHVKKAIRDDGGVIGFSRVHQLAEEVGDVLWYVGALAEAAGFTLEEVARMNIRKLREIQKGDRKETIG